MDVALGALKKIFSKNFARTSVLKWGTITYSHVIFFTSIFAYTYHFFRNRANILFFRVYKPMDKGAWSTKKIYEDLRIELGNHHVC